MKIFVIIVRTLMGLLFLFSAIVVFFNLYPAPELHGNMKTFNDGIMASGYLIYLIKVVETICALAFISGRFVPLATVMIFPITVNILFCHAFLAPDGLPVALFLFLGNLLLAYYHRKSYAPLFVAK